MHREYALDFDSLARRLRPLAGQRGWRLVIEARAASTNASVREAFKSASDGAPCVALAATQTDGVGRRGSHWSSGPGDGLWFSLALPAEQRPNSPAGAAPPSLALAGELADRLRRAGVPVEVKWPNDLYLADGKLGGLMLERGRLGDHVAWVAGVGINWRLPDRDLASGYHPACLSQAQGAAKGEAWRDDPVGLALDLVIDAVDLILAPNRWAVVVDSLRRRHYWYGVAVDVIPERGAGYRAVGGDIRPDGLLEVIRDDGRRLAVGPNDRVRAAST